MCFSFVVGGSNSTNCIRKNIINHWLLIELSAWRNNCLQIMRQSESTTFLCNKQTDEHSLMSFAYEIFYWLAVSDVGLLIGSPVDVKHSTGQSPSIRCSLCSCSNPRGTYIKLCSAGVFSRFTSESTTQHISFNSLAPEYRSFYGE